MVAHQHVRVDLDSVTRNHFPQQFQKMPMFVVVTKNLPPFQSTRTSRDTSHQVCQFDAVLPCPPTSHMHTTNVPASFCVMLRCGPLGPL